MGKLRIIVGGLVGQYPLGGVAWDYFHYALALHELGHEVYYHEDTWVWPYDPVKGYPTDDPAYTVEFIRSFFATYAPGMADRWCYVLLHETYFGMTREGFEDVCRSADVYLNVSGACFVPEMLPARCRRVFLDTDPGYNQIVMATRPAWSENVDRWVEQVRAHDVHLTYAENIHADDCAVPKVGLDWRVTRPPVTLTHWADLAANPPAADAPFSTIMTWSYFKGALVHDGVEYFGKSAEYDKFDKLPKQSGVPVELAVAGYTRPDERLVADGWLLAD
ncbi:MAG: hypothetical protein ACFCVE_00745, partial [Phycisphaerae bacterium]